MRVCAWCNTDLDTGKKTDPGQIRQLCENGHVSHGLCKPCHDDISEQFNITQDEIENSVSRILC